MVALMIVSYSMGVFLYPTHTHNANKLPPPASHRNALDMRGKLCLNWQSLQISLTVRFHDNKRVSPFASVLLHSVIIGYYS